MKENLDIDQSKDETEKDENPMKKLEDALVLCKFGRFHVFLMISTLVAVCSSSGVTTANSYILSNAECDLSMSMMQKGILNAIPFLGQICAAPFTGFMIDAFGRKLFLVRGNFALFVCAVFGALSQTYAMLLFGKLMEGIFMSLIFNATASMVTEFSPRDVRDRVLLLYSSFMSLSIIIFSLLAWAILPIPMNFVIVKGYFEMHSWNILLLATSGCSLLASILYWYLPESPKFLLSQGQENEALDVLKTIYKVNTGKEKETFPVTSLNISGTFTPTVETSIKKQLTDALFHVKELFRGPLAIKLFLFSVTTFTCLLSYSALRLWYPQLSTIIENYQIDHVDEPVRFCVIMTDYRKRSIVNTSLQDVTVVRDEICIPQISESETYTNGMILGFVSLFCMVISGSLVDYMGQKLLMFIYLMLCGGSSAGLYWTNSSLQIAILVSGSCACIQAAFSLQHNILVRVFPTTVRTIAMSLVLMFGRIGSLSGSILFPVMLEIGCMAPFILLSSVSICVAGVIYFLPNPNKENSGTGDK